MTLVLFILVNLVFFCLKMIICIKIEISRNDFYNELVIVSVEGDSQELQRYVIS